MKTRSILAAGAAAAMLWGCAKPTPPAPLQRESVQQVEATVVGIQKQKRLVSLRGPEGRTLTVEAGPEVRNFDQIQVGDQVIASPAASRAFDGRVSELQIHPAPVGGLALARPSLQEAPARAVQGEATAHRVALAAR